MVSESSDTQKSHAEQVAEQEATVLAAGAWLSIGASIGIFGLGLWGFFSAKPPPMALLVSLLVIGFGGALLGWFTLRGRRIAWAFAVSLNGTLAAVLMFAGPRLRDLMGASLVVAELPALLFAVITTLLIVSGSVFERAGQSGQ